MLHYIHQHLGALAGSIPESAVENLFWLLVVLMVLCAFFGVGAYICERFLDRGDRS